MPAQQIIRILKIRWAHAPDLLRGCSPNRRECWLINRSPLTTIPTWLQMLLLPTSPAGFSLFRWMLIFPGPAPPTRHGIFPLIGVPRGRQAPPIPPSSTAHSAISPMSSQELWLSATAHGDRCRSKRHDLFQRRPDPHNRGRRHSGTGILIDNASAFTLTINARVGLDASQTWTNNSGNLFTVSGATLSLGEDNTLRSTAPETRLSQPLPMVPVVWVQPLLRTVAAR